MTIFLILVAALVIVSVLMFLALDNEWRGQWAIGGIWMALAVIVITMLGGE